MTASRPEWLARIEAAADEQYDARPGKPLTPELAARIARLLPPPPADGQQAA